MHAKKVKSYKFYDQELNIYMVLVTKKCWAEHFPALKGSPVCKSHLKRLKQHNPLQQNSYDDVDIHKIINIDKKKYIK